MNINPNIGPKFDPISSSEAMFAGKLKEAIESGKIDKLPLNDDKTIREILLKKFKGKHPKFSENIISDIIKELKKVGDIFEVPVEKIKELKKEPEREFMPVNIGVQKLTVIEDDEAVKIAKKNIDAAEIIKQVKVITEKKEIVAHLFEKSKRVLEVDEGAEDYIKAGLYSREEVEAHNNQVQEFQEIFDKKNSPEKKEIKKLATIFEAIFIKGVNLSKCLGEEVIAKPAYPIDDICEPKIDCYLLLKNVPLGIDVSMRNINGEDFLEKIEKNLRMIGKDKKEGIRYFEDLDGNLERDIFTPKIIMSCDMDMIRELMSLFSDPDEDKFSEKLQSHRMSREIVSQVIGQCRIFGEYAKYKKQDKVAGHYKNILSIIDEIAKTSPILRMLKIGAGGDAVSKKIEEIVHKFMEKEERNALDLQEFRDSRKKAA